MAILLNGRKLAKQLNQGTVKPQAAELPRPPGLAVLLVGEDPASQVYVRRKGLVAERVGFTHRQITLPADTPEDVVLGHVRDLNRDDSVDGILVQLPLPKHIDSTLVLNAIDPSKDVDGFHVVNAGRLATGGRGLVPCTPLGCLMLLKHELGDLSGLEAVVVGRSNIVGKPMVQLLLGESCTVTVAHSRTRDLPEVCRRADILVAAVGRPEMVRGDWIKPGATVIDVGINRVPSKDPARAAEGKTRVVGDVAFDEAAAVAGAITPVPGGVGPMTIAVLLANTYAAACAAAGVAAEPLDA